SNGECGGCEYSFDSRGFIRECSARKPRNSARGRDQTVARRARRAQVTRRPRRSVESEEEIRQQVFLAYIRRPVASEVIHAFLAQDLLIDAEVAGEAAALTRENDMRRIRQDFRRAYAPQVIGARSVHRYLEGCRPDHRARPQCVHLDTART